MSNRERGDRARDVGNWPAAIVAYAAHLAGEPQDFAIWVQLGHANKEAGDYHDALQAYLRAASLDSRDPDLFLNLGHLYKVRGQIDLALEAYDMSASLQPDLFGGASMVAREQIIGRVTWRSEGYAVPSNLRELLVVIEEAETGGRRIFQDYYRSFEIR